MTLAQAMERIRWDFKLVRVRSTDFVRSTDSYVPCEVCDDEFCDFHDAEVQDPDTGQNFYVLLGPLCTRDLRRAIDEQEARERKERGF